MPLLFSRPKCQDEASAIITLQGRFSFPREAQPTLCFIFRLAGRSSPSFPRVAKKRRLRCSLPGIFLARSRWPERERCERSRPQPLPPVRYSRSRRRKYSASSRRNISAPPFFLKFIVIRGMRTQADLIDQLFNSSEKRLARTLLLMAEYGEPGAQETFIP